MSIWHLRELMDVVEQGDRAALVFCVSRADATSVSPADSIDPEYGKTLRAAAAACARQIDARRASSPSCGGTRRAARLVHIRRDGGPTPQCCLTRRSCDACAG